MCPVPAKCRDDVRECLRRPMASYGDISRPINGLQSPYVSMEVQAHHYFPCAMALRLIACSPRRTALLPPLRPEKQLPPGALTPAPRRQDHTPLPYASAALVCRSFRVHRIPVPRSRRWPTPLWAGRDGDRYAPDLAFG